MEMWQLQQLQGLPLKVKIRKTQERIKEWYEFYNGQVYVSFSGGKDSTVLLHIVREMYPDIEAVFVDTGLEYPEIRQFVKSFDNVTWLKPKMNFKEVIDKYGYPVISKEVSNAIQNARYNIIKGTDSVRLRQIRGVEKDKDGKKSSFNKQKYEFMLDAPFKISDQCCGIMKKTPIHLYERKCKKKAIVGTMADESQLRKVRYLKYGCNSFDQKNPQSVPLSFWTEQDVLHYIKKIELSYCKVYGDIIPSKQVEGQTSLEGTYEKLKTNGCTRTGCMFCMYGVHLEKGINRFQMMKESHPKQYDYCINKLGLGEVLDFINVKY